MTLKVTVPNISSEVCKETIIQAVHIVEPDARVDVDIQAKTVTVEALASDEAIKQAILASGYSIDGYLGG